MTFAPLRYPEPWPPPEPSRLQPTWIEKVPLLRNLFEAVAIDPQLAVWNDIQRQICDQLNLRPPSNVAWPQDPVQQRIAAALARAVAKEKTGLLHHVTLHEDDPVVLLLWGPVDDMTPLVFVCEVEAAFRVKIEREGWSRVIPDLEHWQESIQTVGETIQKCLQFVPQ